MSSPLKQTAALARLVRPAFPSGWASLPYSRSDLTLANTLPVGQSFLWHRHSLPSASLGPTEEFSRAVDNPPRVVCLRQTDAAIFYTAVYPPSSPDTWDTDRRSGTTKRWLDDYFQLTRYPDLGELYGDWRKRDPAFFATVELGSGSTGVRVLRQDPWECLVAFITSANNNIVRITSLLHKLCERFSAPLLADDENDTVYRLFPSSTQIPTDGLEAVLRELGFGYRAGYLSCTLSALKERGSGSVEDELARWRSLPLDQVRDELLALKGVGRKVADCVMLMCMDQPSLIPIDTHIYNIASRHPSLPSRLRKPKFASNMYNDIQGFLVEAWGPLGGWCQAVVFAAEIERRKRAGATKVVKAVIAKTEDVDSVVLAKIEHVETATLDIKRKPEIEQTTRAGRYSKRTRK